MSGGCREIIPLQFYVLDWVAGSLLPRTHPWSSLPPSLGTGTPRYAMKIGETEKKMKFETRLECISRLDGARKSVAV